MVTEVIPSDFRFPRFSANLSIAAVNNLEAQLIGTCDWCRCIGEATEQAFWKLAFEELTKRVMEIRAEKDLIVLCNSSLEDWYAIVFYSLFFFHIFFYLKFEWLKQKGF